jgi:hypothetical protein
MKLYLFRTVPPSIIRSLFTVNSAKVYVIQICRQPSSRTRMELTAPAWSCSKAVYKPVWHIPLLSVQWINSWRRTEELPETCRVSCQNKFVKLVHLVGFSTKKSAEEFKSQSSSLLYSPVSCTYPVLGSNILPTSLYCYTFLLYSILFTASLNYICGHVTNS